MWCNTSYCRFKQNFRQKQNTDSCEETINNQRAEIGELTAKIRELNQEVDSLKKQLERMKTAVSRSAEILNKAQSTSS
jgi:predicted RNase H-like nuclease (RuvC/YqgF family)